MSAEVFDLKTGQRIKNVSSRIRRPYICIIRVNDDEEMLYVMKHGRDEVAISVVSVFGEGFLYFQTHFFFPSCFDKVLEKRVARSLHLYTSLKVREYTHYICEEIDGFQEVFYKLHFLSNKNGWQVRSLSLADFQSRKLINSV